MDGSEMQWDLGEGSGLVTNSISHPNSTIRLRTSSSVRPCVTKNLSLLIAAPHPVSHGLSA